MLRQRKEGREGREGSEKGKEKVEARPSVPKMDAILGVSFPVLDNGFVVVRDYMGGDQAVVQAARVSYGAGTKTVREDEGLIRYLMRNRHTSPFEQCQIKIHAKMPIFVARQWVRHRTAALNEESARYSILKDEFYCPELERWAKQSISNRQGSGEALEAEDARRAEVWLREHSQNAYEAYQQMLGPDFGIARELARMNLTLNYYTSWYWTINLWNLLHFLDLRMDPHAQYEIRVYAEVIGDIVEQWVPLCWRAFEDYVRDAQVISGPALAYLRQLIQNIKEGEAPQFLPKRPTGLSKGEEEELLHTIGLT